jgi:hypothetical protein
MKPKDTLQTKDIGLRAAAQSGKGEFFSLPPHTTGHAGPHPAVHYDEASLVLMVFG